MSDTKKATNAPTLKQIGESFIMLDILNAAEERLLREQREAENRRRFFFKERKRG